MSIMIKLTCTKCGEKFERELEVLVKKNDPQYIDKALCDRCELIYNKNAQHILETIFGGFDKNDKTKHN